MVEDAVDVTAMPLHAALTELDSSSAATAPPPFDISVKLLKDPRSVAHNPEVVSPVDGGRRPWSSPPTCSTAIAADD